MFDEVLYGSAKFCEDLLGSENKEKFLQDSVEVPQKFEKVLLGSQNIL